MLPIHSLLRKTIALAAATTLGTATANADASKPNLVVIVADDLGYADLSFLPQSPADVQTPNIDRLAKLGTYFSDAYATAPICSPSRAGLITGRYQQRWGNFWYGQGGLPASELTIPKALKPLGYHTQKIGKTHLNGGEAEHPLDHGFDESLGFIHHTWDYIRLSQDDLQAYKDRANGQPLGILNVGPLERNRGESASYEDGFTTEIFTNEALKTIESHQDSDSSFYIQLEHNAVHMPTYVAHPDYAKKAGYEQPEWNPEADHWDFPFWDPNDMSWGDWHKKWGHLGEVDPLGRKRYLANLMALDDSVGQILDTLEATRQLENTILVFTSDNGGTINTYSNNTPLRGYKYMFGEGGIRVPLIVAWPGHLPGGTTNTALASAMDIFPTVLELIDLDRPDNLDGQSLVPTLKGETTGDLHDHLCWSDNRGTRVVRKGPWKLIESPGWLHSNYKLNEENIAHPAPDYEYPEGLVLFNLADDIGETTNVAAEHPDIVEELNALYDTWRPQMAPRKSKKKKKISK
jgi:arylsulfatase B